MGITGESDYFGILDNDSVFPSGGRIACQGVRGAYSAIAAKRMFPEGELMFFKNFDAVAEAVEKGLCDFGMLPVENNTFGPVKATYEVLKKGKVFIVRSEKLLISHRLLVKPNTAFSDIKEIYSHEQALGQCAGFLSTLPEDVKRVPSFNTALAAKFVAESERSDIAAIASPEAGELYGLTPLDMKIQDSDNNYTRFVCVARERKVYPGANRISLILSCPHRPGSLHHILGEFASLNLNLLRLESHPIVGRDFEFSFSMDIEAQSADERVKEMLISLSKECPFFLYLGNYMEI
jgi:chorismate mutase/prephenate dehydratase